MKSVNGAAVSSASSSPTGSFGTLLFPLLGVILVIFLTYAVTRWIAKKYRRDAAGKCVKVVERIPLGKDRDLVMIETDGKAYLLGVTGQDVSVICSYGAEKLPQRQEAPSPVFSGVLDAVRRGEFFKMPPLKDGGKGET